MGENKDSTTLRGCTRERYKDRQLYDKYIVIQFYKRLVAVYTNLLKIPNQFNSS